MPRLRWWALALAFRAHASCLGFRDSARLQQSRACAASHSAAFGWLLEELSTAKTWEQPPEIRLASAHSLGGSEVQERVSLAVPKLLLKKVPLSLG